mmetsp:Transcript_1651/g.3814  ORF Transcript_1651/g.3814 Transcript_1651/m.3814 type:complete len:204 (+) Transcript_1651:81-692(+)
MLGLRSSATSTLNSVMAKGDLGNCTRTGHPDLYLVCRQGNFDRLHCLCLEVQTSKFGRKGQHLSRSTGRTSHCTSAERLLSQPAPYRLNTRPPHRATLLYVAPLPKDVQRAHGNSNLCEGNSLAGRNWIHRIAGNSGRASGRSNGSVDTTSQTLYIWDVLRPNDAHWAGQEFCCVRAILKPRTSRLAWWKPTARGTSLARRTE